MVVDATKQYFGENKHFSFNTTPYHLYSVYMVYGAIQVLRNSGGTGCQISQKKVFRRCTVQCY